MRNLTKKKLALDWGKSFRRGEARSSCLTVKSPPTRLVYCRKKLMFDKARSLPVMGQEAHFWWSREAVLHVSWDPEDIKLVLDKARSLCLITPKLLFGEARSFWKVPVPILLGSIKCWTRRKCHLMKSFVWTLRVSSRLRVIIILGSSYYSGNIWNLLPTRREKKIERYTGLVCS